jgi:hypothetical protein
MQEWRGVELHKQGMRRANKMPGSEAKEGVLNIVQEMTMAFGGSMDIIQYLER